MRQALNYAVDKAAYCKVVGERLLQPSLSPLPDLLGFYEPQKPYPYDVAKAKALLAEAGYPNGFETEIFSPTTPPSSAPCSSSSSSWRRWV